VRLENTTGYSFDVSVDMFPDVETGPDECAVGIVLESPRSASSVLPRAVERYAVEALAIHLRAMLDGLVEVIDPESEDGYAQFPQFYLRIRQLPSPTGSVSFEIHINDCGCAEDEPFLHGAILALTLDRDDLARKIDVLESEVWADHAEQRTR